MATIIVNTTLDETFDGGDLANETGDGNGLSLREALGLANATVDQDEITFAAGLSGETLTLTQGELVISSDAMLDGDVTGDGGAPEITLDANDTSRVINITAGSSTLNGLVITGGTTDASGGGIWNSGTLTLSGTTVSDNYAGTWGGGIHNDGTAALTNTTITGNSIDSGAAGGGISNFGTATLTNTTVSGNSVDDGTGGGIHNRGALNLTNTTVSGNSVDLFSYLGAGSGIDNGYGTATLTNTIVLGNTPSVPNSSEIMGTIIQAGPNIIGGSAADVFAETVDNDGVDAGLLADNGGAVRTIALKNDASNPALDAGLDDRLDESIVGIDLNGDGDTDDVIDTDARGNGFERIVEQTGIAARNQIDLGAVELQQIVSPPGPQEEPSLVVTTTADTLDRFDGETSLREALALANDPEAGSQGDGDADDDGNPTDTITFAAGLSGGTITLANGELVIGSDVAIDGDLSGDGGAPEITLDADGASRVIRIASGSSTLDGLVMTGGRTFDFYSQGAGIFVASGARVAIVNSAISDNSAPTFKLFNFGGGMSNNGTLTLTNTTVSGNASGGIVNAGTLMLNNSTVSGNRANFESGGGGISNQGSGTATLINTTVSDNYGGGGFSRGGGIYNHPSGTATLINTTVSGNSAFRGGGVSGPATLINTTVSDNHAYYEGGIYGPATLANSIVLGNSASMENAEIGGDVIANGPNIIRGSAADVFAETYDSNGVAAGVLADNGGPVQTIALKNDPSNPALDAGQDDQLDESVAGIDLNGDGDMADVIDTDARGDGFGRFADQPDVANNGANTVDLGAFELPAEEPGGPDPNLIPVTVTFKAADAYNCNAFGIYNTSTLTAELLAADLGAAADGAVLYEAEVTAEQLDRLGFFLIPDGADENADLADLVGEELTVESTAGGYAVSFGGAPLAGRGAPALFSDAALNPGGLDHFVEDGTPAAYGLSVEDVAGGGDLDFDDALFEVETGVAMTGARVEMTFESESAGFHNAFGHYREDTGAATIVFADIDAGTLAPGTTESFDLSAEAHDELVFFLIPDGGRRNADPFADLDALDLIIEEADGGLRARDQATGTVLEGFVHPVYVPEKAGNPDATRHALQIGDLDRFQLRWEDLPGGGDADYDDTVIGVQITPDALVM